MKHMDGELARGFLRGELDAQSREYWQAHLRTCARCRERLAQEQALSGLLKLADEPAAPAVGVERVVARVVGSPRRFGLGRLLGLPSACILAGLSGVGAGWLYRVSTAPSVAEQLAGESGIGAELQQEVVGRLDELRILAADQWLVDEYEAVRWFESLLTERSPEAGG